MIKNLLKKCLNFWSPRVTKRDLKFLEPQATASPISKSNEKRAQIFGVLRLASAFFIQILGHYNELIESILSSFTLILSCPYIFVTQKCVSLLALSYTNLRALKRVDSINLQGVNTFILIPLKLYKKAEASLSNPKIWTLFSLFLTAVFLLQAPCAYAESWITFDAEEICGDANIPCLAKKMEATFADGTKITCAESYFDPEKQTVTIEGNLENLALLEGKLPSGEAYTAEALRYTLHKHQQQVTVNADAPVAIHFPGRGEVRTDGRMELTLLLDSSRRAHTLMMEGTITLKLEEHGNKFCSIPGKLFLDFEQGIITAFSSQRSSKQIYFEDNLGGLFADGMTIHYDLKTHHPLKYLLEGRVRVKNIFAVNETLMGKLDQHAVADSIEYDVVKGKAILNARDGHRVLFLDQANKMQVSAGELHILFDKETKTPSVKGIGDVRLTFGEKELKKMEKAIKDFEAHKVLPD